MSSYIIVDVDALADLLVDIWSANARQRKGRNGSDAAALQQEKMRLDQAEREARAAERQLDLQYEEALAALGARPGADTARDHAFQVAQFGHRRRELQFLARSLAQEVETLGAGYLADFANYREKPALYHEIARLKQSIRQTAAEIENDSGLITEYDAESRFQALNRLARQMEESYDRLMELFASSTVLREEARAKQQRFAALLAQLANGTQAAVRQIEILPRTLPGAAAEAQVVRYALDTVRFYLLGPESALLSESQRQELRRLYDLQEGRPLAEIAARSARELKPLNEQFRAAKKRSFDRTIAERRQVLEETRERSRYMYETVHGSMSGWRDAALEAAGDPEAELAVLREEIARMERRYYQIQRQRLLEDTLDRALKRSRTGMQVRHIGTADTRAGNRRMLYQIGADGTAMEVYTDARGQILIEAGGIVEDRAPASKAQSETIGRNMTYFCDHELPAILEALDAELKAADLHGKVMLRREPEEDRLHLFTLDTYPEAGDALIIARDGTVRREDAPAAPTARTLEAE